MIENARRQVVLVVVVLLAALYFIFAHQFNLGLDLQGGTQLVYEVDFQAARDKGLLPKDAHVDDVMNETVRIISDRIDPTGTIEAPVTRRGENGILVELPGMSPTEAEATQQRIQTLGQLETRIVAEATFEKDGVKFDLAKEKERLESWLKQDEHRAQVAKDPQAIDVFNRLAGTDEGPVSKWLRWYPRLIKPGEGGKQWDYALAHSSTGGVTAVMATPEKYSTPPAGADDRLVEFVAVNMKERHFTGENMLGAAVHSGNAPDTGKPAVFYEMKPEFGDDYAKWSKEYLKKHSAIILNGFVKSAPYFESEITGGRGQISGSFTQQEAADLAKVLKSGSLTVQPVLVSKQAIGATLGRQAVQYGMLSVLLGGFLVLAFMLYYYRLSGLVAGIAIIVNVVLMVGMMQFIRATFTLPGIAGVVLTMGMAVDANILIYERIREELKRGKALLQAVRAGFERAMVTILDANITTFLAGLVLYNVGIGPIRGFAVTLMIGILTTLFSAFFVSRLVFHYLLEWKRMRDFSAVEWFKSFAFDWLKYRKVAFTISVLINVIGLAALFLVPANRSLGLDFTGGAGLRMALATPMTAAEMRRTLEEDKEFASMFPSAQVNTAGELDTEGRAREFTIKLKLSDELRDRIKRDEELHPGAEPIYVQALAKRLAGKLVPQAFSDEKFVALPNNPTVATALVTLHFGSPVKVQDVIDKLKPKHPEVAVIEPKGQDVAKDIRLEFEVDAGEPKPALFSYLTANLQDLRDTAGEKVPLSNPFPEAAVIGARMVGELRNSAIGALLLAMFLIAMYIRVRFHEYKWGIAAVIALVHDVLVAVAFVVIFNALGLVSAEIDLGMIAAFLTIIGYSVNDTIVIFDRMRENLSDAARLGTNQKFEDILNLSINQTLSRTILTTGTTMFVVLAQFLVNYGRGSTLEGFSFALLVGFFAGVYSTPFIATPVVLWLHNRELRRHPPSRDTGDRTAPTPGKVTVQTG